MHISLILFKQKRLYYTFKVLVFQLIYLRFLYSLLTLPHFYGSAFHCVNVQEHPYTSTLVCFCKYVLTLNSQHRSCWGKTMHVVPFLLNSRRPHWMSTRLCSVWASELAYWSKLCFLIYLLNIEKIFFLYITPKARNLELLFLLMVGQMKFSLRASQIYRLYTFERSDTDRSPCEVT